MGSIGRGTLVVNAWVAVHDGCEISCKVKAGSGVSVTVVGTNRRHGPGGDEEFEFFFETEVLRTFLTLGAAALSELDGAAGDHAADDTDDAGRSASVVEVRSSARGVE